MSDDRQIDSLASGDWRRWQMDKLHRPLPAAADDQTNPRRAKQRWDLELQALRAEARQSGHREGREAAFAEGREAGYREGFDAGRKDGHTEGLEVGRQQAARELEALLGETVAPLQPLATRFAQALDSLDGEIIDGLVNLALATGRQLARDRLDIAPEIILDIVRELLHNEPSLSGKPRLWLHPEDLNIVQEHLGGEFTAAGWTLQPDDQITRGGCRVSSPNGELDATWESRWRAICGQVRQRHISVDEDSGQ